MKLLAATLCLACELSISARQQARDPSTAAGPPLGTGVIAGLLTTDEAATKPIRRAIVTLAVSAVPGGPGLAAGSSAGPTSIVTDDAGRFAFVGLPPGRFTISAAKPAYLNASYGAKRPGRAGTPVQLTEGQQLTNLTIRMSRGGVIAGMITNQGGEPAPNAAVGLMRAVYSAQSGERTVQSSGSPVTSDDRGMYRFFGVAPGEYYVQLQPRIALPGELRQTTEQGVQAAMQQWRAARGASVTAVTPTLIPAGDPPGPTVGYAPVFYPGAASTAAATLVKIAAGEERVGIDIQVRLVPTAKVEGIVVGPDGQPAPGAQLSMLNSGPGGVGGSTMSSMMSMLGMARPAADGTFTIPAVAPGQYTIAARSNGGGRGLPVSPLAMGPTGAALWATAEVTVDGQDVQAIRLTLEPGMNLSGKIAFAGTTPAPKDLSTMRVNLTAVLTGAAVAPVIAPAAVTAEGAFTFSGVTPGRYRLASVAGAPWGLKSVTSGGRDVIDSSLEVRPGGALSDVVMTFGDHPTELTGSLQDASGRPAPEYFIIAYPSDRALWTAPTRRVAQTRPGSDGKFIFRNLPPGDYLLAAVTDVEPGEWMDPAFLALLVDSSIKITLAEGDRKTQDIKIAGG